MKICTCCGKLKPDSEFHWRNKALGKKRGYCRECQSDKPRMWYEENSEQVGQNVRELRQDSKRAAREYVQDYLSTHPFVDCGESNPVVLEFDHVRGRKKMSISRLVSDGYSISALDTELSKCVVRCANCHRIKTVKERGWFRR